ncbi:MAG TPA: DNA polymerase III subunit delta' [Dongiaceae bacterium]|jgi:DNA polymerase-3 subunit delta'|nr:DNA polymerase III subunit delta' [Dongiaceae bacterium]
MPPKAKTIEAPVETGPAWAERLIGHEVAEQAFLTAFSAGRLPHAWLISGPQGVGKATFAYRIARFLLAQPNEMDAGGLFGAPEAPANFDMAPDHRVFRQVARQGHPDFRLLERTPNPKTGRMRNDIVIEDVRAVIDFLHLKPAASPWRVVIVDSADDLNRNSANALLKILEEPSANTVILLLSHAPQALLPTIRSRCRKLVLQPLPLSLLAAELAARFPDIKPQDRGLAVATAGGSLGQAIRMIERDGVGLIRDIGALLASWPKLDAGLLHKLGDKLGGRDQDAQFDLAVELLGWWFARMARIAATGEKPEIQLFEGETALIGRMQAAASLDRWLALWEKVSRLFDRVRAVNLDRKQAWVAAFLAIEGFGR